MKVTYDPRHNIGYICFREKPAAVQTLHISEELNVDVAADGTVYGIELLNANSQFAGDPWKELIVENGATGSSTVVALPA